MFKPRTTVPEPQCKKGRLDSVCSQFIDETDETIPDHFDSDYELESPDPVEDDSDCYVPGLGFSPTSECAEYCHRWRFHHGGCLDRFCVCSGRLRSTSDLRDLSGADGNQNSRQDFSDRNIDELCSAYQANRVQRRYSI
ncbi:hypothetical protein QAD02_010150 [Eretmocerus hayati]|uniref:Uncharacterized protein n=1 Tax=Eretmocerus hayati TaxID=131215 RepID=A0ACC2NDW7_9HYME|nr:hypothetical protein QAD02_010150 [Eretmocerus hayati]